MDPAECFREAQRAYAAPVFEHEGVEACCPRFTKWMRVAGTGIVLRQERRLFKPDCGRRRSCAELIKRVYSTLIVQAIFEGFSSFCLLCSYSRARVTYCTWVLWGRGASAPGAFLELNERNVKGS